jgi:hypothetical protein
MANVIATRSDMPAADSEQSSLQNPESGKKCGKTVLITIVASLAAALSVAPMIAHSIEGGRAKAHQGQIEEANAELLKRAELGTLETPYILGGTNIRSTPHIYNLRPGGAPDLSNVCGTTDMPVAVSAADISLMEYTGRFFQEGGEKYWTTVQAGSEALRGTGCEAPGGVVYVHITRTAGLDNGKESAIALP